MKLTTSFDFSKVLFNKSNTINMLVSATAPKVDWESERKPISIVAAIDESSSMMGDKIEYAKKSLLKLIENLASTDRLAIVGFASNVRVVSEMLLMSQGNKDRLKVEVQKIHANGCTHFSGAVAESFRLAQQADGACRVILFTDGEPTTGNCNLDGIANSVKGRSDLITVSTFGYGDGHDSKFLSGLADIGQGNYSYVKNPDDALVAFARELGGLLSCYAQNLKFTIMPRPDVKIVEVVSDVDVEQLDGGAVRISVPNLYGEETRHIVVKVMLPEQKNVLPRAKTVVDVELVYDAVKEAKAVTLNEKARVCFVKADDVQTKPNQTVHDQATMAQIAQANRKADEAAKRGDFSAAGAFFSNIQLSEVSDCVLRACTTASSNYADVNTYTSNAHNVNAMKSAFRSGRGAGGQSLGLFTDNSTMDCMVQNFTAPPDVASSGVVAIPDPNQGGITTTTDFSLLNAPPYIDLGNLDGLVVGSVVTNSKEKPLSKKCSNDW